jgi:DHA1 family florfenicol/chloramphenicol resistance protein-like MFS transporter
VALHFCVQSLIASIGGTLAVIRLQGYTAWPLATFLSIIAIIVLAALGRLRYRGRVRA